MSFVSAHTGGPTQMVTVTGTSQRLMLEESEATSSARAPRKYALIVADLTNAGPVYLRLKEGAAVAQQGIPLYPGTRYEIGFDSLYQGEINAVSAAGQSNILYVTRGY